MPGINSKNINSGVAGAEPPKQLMLQKLEENQRSLQALNTAKEQKSAELKKVQAEINELKKLYTGGKSR